jgi:hypothetical protein
VNVLPVLPEETASELVNGVNASLVPLNAGHKEIGDSRDDRVYHLYSAT